MMGDGYRDPELEDVLQDEELLRIAVLLGSMRTPEPPLDEAFRTGLRRQLMQQAWAMAEGRASWWRRAFAPPGLAWLGAAVGVILIAAVVINLSGQGPGGPFQVTVSSNLDGSSGVPLQQPILVSFNQPMDHSATEAAVQVMPATTVAFSWEGNTLSVQPTSGNLAPNTQYQVTIGPGARTASGQPLSSPHSITFVTEPPPPPAPVPSPRPTPSSNTLLTGEKQLAQIGGSAAAGVQWAADSSAIYYVDPNGALDVVPAKGGQVTTIAPSGTSSPAISPTGDRLAYIRGGKIEVLTFASGKTDELAPTPAPTLVDWSQTQLVWTAADGVYAQAGQGQKQIATFAAAAPIAPIAFSPDGSRLAYRADQSQFVLDLQSGSALHLNGANFLSFSPGGSMMLYATTAGVVVADLQGNVQATLPAADVSWSSQDAILLGTDTDVSFVRPDGTGLTKLSNGTYRSPAWAPDGASFVFIRGTALWIATAPGLPPEATPLDQAAASVKAFMDARLNGQPDQAGALLDANGKQAYSAKGMNLEISGDPRFSRYYILTQELISTDPETARFVVRLVLSHGKLDVSDFEETLALVRDATSGQFLVDQAASGPRRDLGNGAQVVSVDIARDTIKVAFDSDLDPGTVTGGIVLLDAKGKPIAATATYDNRVVTLTGLDLKEHGAYRLVVLPTLRDVAGHNIADEYDLDLLGPVLKRTPDNKQAVAASPTPAVGPTATPGS